MTDEQTGEFIATQKAMVDRLDKLEETVATVGKKVTLGKGILIGAAVASGGGWAVVTSVASKVVGGP